MVNLSSLFVPLAFATSLIVAPYSGVQAQEDEDLDLIPVGVGEALNFDEEAPAALDGFIEGLVANNWGTNSGPDLWCSRASGDIRERFKLGDKAEFYFSNRTSVLVGTSDCSKLDSPSVRNDLRELHLIARLSNQLFFGVGRANFKHGVALGYNPTDFLRRGSKIEQASLDPNAARENRLGVFAGNLQYFWRGGEVNLIFAPKLASFDEADEASGFDIRATDTNGDNRWLLSLSQEVLNLSPQMVLLLEEGRAQVGLNLSRQIGDSVVAYAEFSGGNRTSLLTCSDLQVVGQRDAFCSPNETFRLNMTVGGSLSSARLKTTLAVEYHMNEVGLTKKQWESLASSSAEPHASLLTDVRRRSARLQEPISRHRIFIRAARDDFLFHNLDASAISFVNVADGSGIVQVSLNYAINSKWSASAFLSRTFGSSVTEYGSLPTDGGISFQLRRYF